MRLILVIFTVFTFFSTVQAASLMTEFSDASELKLARETLVEVQKIFAVQEETLVGAFGRALDMQGYAKAVRGETFVSKAWGAPIKTLFARDHGCSSNTYAHVSHNQDNPDYWVATVHLCDLFFQTKDLKSRAQTMSHELVHVVNGQGECLPMLVSFWLNKLSYGDYIYKSNYWESNQCQEFNPALPPINARQRSLSDLYILK